MVTPAADSAGRNPAQWGISWSGRMHQLREPLGAEGNPKKIYATARCGSSVYLRPWLASRDAQTPAFLLELFDAPSTPVCKLCARSAA